MNDIDEATVGELRAVLGSEFPVLVDTFAADGERRMAALRAALAASDHEALRETAHSFKGASLNVGAQRLASHCLAIESAARERRLDGLGGEVDAAAAAFRAACGLLRAR